MLQILKSREDSFSPLSQPEPFCVVEGPVKSEAEVEKAAWERSGLNDCAIGLRLLEIFKNLQCFAGNNTLFTLEFDKQSECSAEHQLALTVSVLRTVFAALENETTRGLQVEQPAMSPAKVVKPEY